MTKKIIKSGKQIPGLYYDGPEMTRHLKQVIKKHNEDIKNGKFKMTSSASEFFKDLKKCVH